MKNQYKMSEKDKEIIKNVCNPRNALKIALSDVYQEFLTGSVITLVVIAILIGSVYETRARMAVNSAYRGLQSIFMAKGE